MARRAAVQPDDSPTDGLTSIIPPVRDDSGHQHSGAALERDPLEVVKAAMEGTRPPAADAPADARAPPPPTAPPGRGSGSDGGPPADPPKLKHQINWVWLRRSAYLAVVFVVLLPILTFGMAYLIVDAQAR